MQQLPQERLTRRRRLAVIERALALTIDYVKERHAFGKRILDFQNTQFVLAECKTEANVARVFVDRLYRAAPRGQARRRHRIDGEILGSATSNARSSTAVCNCSAVTAT